MFGVGAFGTGLIVSASGASSTTSGMGIVGTYNTADGVTDNVRQTRFLVGTGTSTGARRTSLHVSASGLTTISTGLTVSGSFNVANGITGSLLGTASFADNATSASFAQTALSASYAPSVAIDTGSFATTGSNTFKGNQIISGSLTIFEPSSQITVGKSQSSFAQFTLQSATNSLMFFETIGPNATSSMNFIGSNSDASKYSQLDIDITPDQGVEFLTYSSSSYAKTSFLKVAAYGGTISTPEFTRGLNIVGSLNAPSITGSLLGTASFATQALSASFYGGTVVSASYALSASEAQHAVSADSATTATSASYSNNSTTASYALNATSASYAASASNADAAATATSASYALNATSASFAQTAISASYAPSSAAFPFTGSAGISGSILLVGNEEITGSLRMRPSDFWCN